MTRRTIVALALAIVAVACESPPVAIQLWVPPVPGPHPDVVARRIPLPFCGVATSPRDPVLRCLLEARQAGLPAEIGIVDPTPGGDQVGIVRLLPDMSVEIFFFEPTDGNPRRAPLGSWRTTRCRRLVEEAPPEIVNVEDCTSQDMQAPGDPG